MEMARVMLEGGPDFHNLRTGTNSVQRFDDVIHITPRNCENLLGYSDVVLSSVLLSSIHSAPY